MIKLPRIVEAGVPALRMRRYAIFSACFALVPLVSGPFVVSVTSRASALEWAHLVSGVALAYLAFGLVLLSARYRELRLPSSLALAAGILMAIPGVPRLHAALAPVLVTTLVLAATALPGKPRLAQGWPRRFLLPALVLFPIVFGVGYRHQTAAFLPHIITATPIAGTLILLAVSRNRRRTAARNTQLVTVVLLQLASGLAVFIIRVLEFQGGLTLVAARSAHITGSALVLSLTFALALEDPSREPNAHRSP